MSNTSTTTLPLMIDLAISYRAAGLSLVPCSEQTKKSTVQWKQYQTTPADESTIRAWFARGCKAVAAVGGKVSGGLLIIDFDVEGFYERWREAVGELADGLPVQRTGNASGKRYQVALRCPEPGGSEKLAWVPDATEETGRKIAIETKGEGGYAILPGSLHPSGRHYEAVAGDWCNIPVVSQARADALLAAARKLDEAPLTRQEHERQETHEASTRLADRQREYSNGQGSVIEAYNAEHEIEDALERYGYQRRGPDRFARPGGKTDSVKVEDGRSYHHSTNDPLESKYWRRPFDLFLCYEHGGTVREAVKAAAESLGLSENRNGHRPHYDSTEATATDYCETTEPSYVETQRPVAQPRIDYRPMSCAELVAAKFDIRFLVESIVAAGQPLTIAGPQKALKTSIALDMAFAMATAGYFLGRFKVPEPVAVGFMSGESGLPTLAETVRRIARAAGRDPAGIRNLVISDRVPQIGSPDHLEAIDAMIQEHALEALFIDPVFMAMDGADAGNLFIQGQLLRRVSELCQERGCTLILLHHVKKGSGNTFEPLELSAIAWSGFAEAARQWLLLSRREPYEPGSGLHRLHLAVGGSAGHGGLWGLDIREGTYQAGVDRLWDVTVLAADEVHASNRDQRQERRKAKADADLEADRREIVGVLTALKDGESKTSIRERCQCGHARFGRAFASLVVDGTVQEASVTKSNGQTYSGWKVNDAQEI